MPGSITGNTLQVIGGLWAAAVIGSWCNFLTVLYIGESNRYLVPIDLTLLFILCNIKKEYFACCYPFSYTCVGQVVQRVSFMHSDIYQA